MSVFKELEPKNLGSFVDVIPKKAEERATDVVASYIKSLENKISLAKTACKKGASHFELLEILE